MRGDIVIAMGNRGTRPFLTLAFALTIPVIASGQDRLKTAPGYERAERMSREGRAAAGGGALSVTWREDGRALDYERGGKRFRYDLAAGTTEQTAAETAGENASSADHGELP